VVAIALSRARPVDLVELTKPRIVLLVMCTAAAGFWVAGPTPGQSMVLFHLLVGTLLVAAGTNALNQVAERDIDGLMRRTRARPLPAGRLDVATAASFAWIIGAAGVAYLGVFVNPLTSGLAAATLLSYVFLYTPLKRRTTLATLVGGVPGALPILGGWTAATNTVSPEALVLFWIMFLWQLPHFLALGWLYREDYGRAGLKMLSIGDNDGKISFMQATVYAAALLPVSLMPTILGTAGGTYFLGALLLSSMFLGASALALKETTVLRARRVFRMSLYYLPLLLALMSVNRIV
jgi:protoheme IX farnesyltransferase